MRQSPFLQHFPLATTPKIKSNCLLPPTHIHCFGMMGPYFSYSCSFSSFCSSSVSSITFSISFCSAFSLLPSFSSFSLQPLVHVFTHLYFQEGDSVLGKGKKRICCYHSYLFQVPNHPKKCWLKEITILWKVLVRM